MKNSFLIFFVSIAVVLHVQAQTKPASRVNAGASGIEKVSYLPQKGKIFLKTELGLGEISLVVSSSAGLYSKTKSTATKFTYVTGYGVADSLALAVGGQVLSSHSDSTYGPASLKNGTTSTEKTSGWEEPELNLIWRVRDNQNSRGKIDLTAAFRPQLQPAKAASNGTDGNEGVGGNQFAVSARLFKEVQNFQFSFIAAQALRTVATREDADNAKNTREISERQSTTLVFGLEAQASEKFHVGGNLTFAQDASYESTSFTSAGRVGSVNYDLRDGTQIEFYTKFKISQSSVLRLSLEMLPSATQAATSGTTKLNISSDSATALTLGWVQEL